MDDEHAGKYRSENVTLSGANHIPPNHVLLPELMQKLFAEYKKEWHNYHPVIKACLLHGEFVKIHSFIDGNGRTARWILNFELMKYGYPTIVIKRDRRAICYEALDRAHTTLDDSKFVQLISDFLIDSQSLWLKIINEESGWTLISFSYPQLHPIESIGLIQFVSALFCYLGAFKKNKKAVLFIFLHAIMKIIYNTGWKPYGRLYYKEFGALNA